MLFFINRVIQNSLNPYSEVFKLVFLNKGLSKSSKISHYLSVFYQKVKNFAKLWMLRKNIFMVLNGLENKKRLILDWNFFFYKSSHLQNLLLKIYINFLQKIFIFCTSSIKIFLMFGGLHLISFWNQLNILLPIFYFVKNLKKFVKWTKIFGRSSYLRRG